MSLNKVKYSANLTPYLSLNVTTFC